MLDILKKSKSVKAHQYREYILSNEEKIEEIIIDDKITCIYKDNTKHKTSKEEMKEKIDKRQFVDFGVNEIIYSDSKILFFEFKDIIYFKAKDICDLLGHVNPTDIISKSIDKTDILLFESIYNKNINDVNPSMESFILKKDSFLDEKSIKELKKIKNDIEKRTNKYIDPNTVFINESALYSLIFSSKLPQAKAFKNWVTSEVLVSIRKTGSYNKVHNAPKYDEYTLKELENQSCLYIIHVRDSLYKFGMTKISETDFY